MFRRKKNVEAIESDKPTEKTKNPEPSDRQEYIGTKIIDGKMYDVSKADKICEMIVSPDEIPERKSGFYNLLGEGITLYKGRTQYFITHYCNVQPVDEEWVKKILGLYNPDKYIELFGEVELA